MTLASFWRELKDWRRCWRDVRTLTAKAILKKSYRLALFIAPWVGP
jgi:hypothetical protein